MTGATGFVGRHVTRLALAQGYEVHATTGLRQDPERVSAIPHGVVVHRVIDDPSWYGELLDLSTPDCILHLATQFVPHHRTPLESRSMLRANVELGALLVDAAAEHRVPFLVAGTYWQRFGGSTYSPVSLYAATKQALWDIVLFYREVASLPVAQVFLPDTYGPGDDRGKLLDSLLDCAARGGPFEASSGLQLIDLLHVRDAAAGLLASVAELAGGSALDEYVLSSGTPMSVQAVAALVERVTGRTLQANWGARPDRPREMRTIWLDPSPPPGWSPTIALEEGVRELWDMRTQSN